MSETSRHGGFLTDVAGFDAEFFGISPKEARAMDPQQRLLLEVAWEALERTGTAPGSLAGTSAGVFVGAWSDDYGRRLLEDLPSIEAWTGVGSTLGSAAARLSYHLGLHGPSLTVDTACSSSLVAVHQACQSLRLGESRLALAAGVNLLLSPGLTVNFDRAGALSPSGRCRAFDIDADGYVRAEGCGVVVLKTLADALADGDPVLGVLRGSAVTQNGHGVGIMAPDSEAQARTVRLACEAAGVEPTTLDYIEAHGTGTPAGDRAEAAGLASITSARLADDPCLVGSVKTNIGHAEAAAGMAGLIKVLLALGHGEIPPSLHHRNPSPALADERHRFRIVTEAVPWPRRARSRRAGVSSYGFGGTNAHLVVEESPAASAAASAVPGAPGAADTVGEVAAGVGADGPDRPMVFPWSGSSEAARERAGGRLADWLREAAGEASAASVAHTLAEGRSHAACRAAAVASDSTEVLSALDTWLAGEAHADLVAGRVLPGGDAGAVWVFSGHGSQWTGMGRELLATEAAFAGVLAELEPVFLAEAGFSLHEFLTGADAEHAGADQIQPVLFAVQTALAEVWRAHGAEPAAVLGHSVGEIAAAVVAGALSRVDGARLVCRRSLLLRRVMGKGAMALVSLPAGEVRELLRREGGEGLSVAISASPEATVVAGGPDDVERAVERWGKEDFLVRRVASDVAFHSPQMDPLLDDLATAADGLAPQVPDIPLYSTSGPEPRASYTFDAAYWVRNLRGEVRLEAAVRAAAEDGHRAFVELSPHPVVVHSIRESLHHASIEDACVVGTLRRATPERRAFLRAAATLHCHGVPVRFDSEAGGSARERAAVPTTAWDHQRHWHDAVSSPGFTGGHAPATGTLLGAPVPLGRGAIGRVWHTLLDGASAPGEPDTSGDRPALAPAVILATLIAAVQDSAGKAQESGSATVCDVSLREPLTLEGERDVHVVAVDGTVSVSSSPTAHDAAATTGSAPDGHGPERLHAACRNGSTGDAGAGARHAPACGAPRADASDDGAPSVAGPPARTGAAAFPWRVVTHRVTDEELTAELEVVGAPTGDEPPAGGWAVWADAALSLACALLPDGTGPALAEELSELSVTGPPPRRALLTLARDESPSGAADPAASEPGGPLFSGSVAGPRGESLTLTGLRFSAPEAAAGKVPPDEILRVVRWEPVPEDALVQASRPAVAVIGASDGPAGAVAAGLRAAGARTVCLEDSGDLAEDAQLARLAGVGTAVLVPSCAEPADGPDTAEHVEELAWQMVRAVRDLARVPEGSAPRLWCAVGDWDGRGSDALGQQALRGLSRVAAGEHPERWGGLIHRDPHTPDGTAFPSLLRVVAGEPRDDVPYEEVLRLTAEGPLRPRLTRAPLAAPEDQRPYCTPDGSYLVTGGLGALGLRIAEELVAAGARRLVLAGRGALPPRTTWHSVTDPRTRYRIERVRQLERAGATVRTVAVDIADEEQVRAVLDPDALDMPPIRGVVHAAGVIHGGTIDGLTRSSLRAELRPKVAGALTLDRLHPPGTVDFFVLFSAVAGQLGLAGQGGYATANAFLDGLAERRRAQGCRHTMSIAWPAWRDTGLAATAGELTAEFEAVGVRDLTAREGLAAWWHAGRRAGAHLVVLPVDRTRRPPRALPLLEELLGEGADADDTDRDGDGDTYRGMSGAELRDRVGSSVRALVAAELGLTVAALDPRRPLAEIGMDSIMALAIRRRMEREFSLALPATLLWNHPTAHALSERITELLDAADTPSATEKTDREGAPGPGTDTASAPAVDGFAALLDEFEADTGSDGRHEGRDGTKESAQTRKGQA